jgi:hypothetical protein
VDESVDLFVQSAALEQRVRPHDIVSCKLEAIPEGIIHVRLRRKMHNRIDRMRFQDMDHKFRVIDITLVVFIIHVLREDILRIATVIHPINIDNKDIGICLMHIIDKVGANKSTTTRHEYIFHFFYCLYFLN